MVNKPEYNCRVCGMPQEEPIWGMDGDTPTFNICSCCGTEFGYDDCSLDAAHEARKQWLEQGNEWWDPKAKPKNWSLEKQLGQIPDGFK